MNQWIKVVTEPLGLAGFALFLVFGYLAKAKSKDERRWLSPIALVIAAIALIGGLSLAYVRSPKPAPAPVEVAKPQIPARQQSNQQVQQTSTGAGSPNVQGVQGDVTITVDQSTGKTTTETQKPAEKKPKPESP